MNTQIQICPYSNGLNDLDLTGHCSLTDNSRCYDCYDNYLSCYFYAKEELKREDEHNRNKKET